MESKTDAKGFTLVELLVVVAIIAILMAILLPALSLARDKARQARCIGNLRNAGQALVMWSDNAKKYPFWDFPWMGDSGSLAAWPEALALEGAFTPERLENRRHDLEAQETPPELFSRTVDNIEVFMCPSDKPHPHRINQERADAWSFIPYEYSYGINHTISYGTGFFRATREDKDASSQILATDSVWSWMCNFRAMYLENENSTFDQPAWYSNTVGYFHSNGLIGVMASRDGSVRSVKYGSGGKGINTQDIFFVERGETLDAYW